VLPDEVIRVVIERKEDEEHEVIHTISFPLTKFLEEGAMELGKSYQQNITLFDDVDDDEFDGDFGEHDEEEPYITTTFVLTQF